MISFGWVALFIFIYIIVVGPLDFIFLKYVIKRMELAWITFPVIVVFISGVAYVTAYYLKGSDLKTNKIDLFDIVTELEPGSSRATSKHVYCYTWFNLFSPRIQKYSIGIEPPEWAGPPTYDNDTLSYSPVVAWMARPADTMGTGAVGSGGLFRSAYDFAPNAVGLTGVPIQVWASKAFAASWHAPLQNAGPNPMVSADLQFKGKKMSGTITSRLPFKLDDACLLYDDDKCFDLGTLQPNEDKKVRPSANQLSDWLQSYPPGLKDVMFYKRGADHGNSGQPSGWTTEPRVAMNQFLRRLTKAGAWSGSRRQYWLPGYRTMARWRRVMGIRPLLLDYGSTICRARIQMIRWAKRTRSGIHLRDPETGDVRAYLHPHSTAAIKGSFSVFSFQDRKEPGD